MNNNCCDTNKILRQNLFQLNGAQSKFWQRDSSESIHHVPLKIQNIAPIKLTNLDIANQKVFKNLTLWRPKFEIRANQQIPLSWTVTFTKELLRGRNSPHLNLDTRSGKLLISPDIQLVWQFTHSRSTGATFSVSHRCLCPPPPSWLIPTTFANMCVLNALTQPRPKCTLPHLIYYRCTLMHRVKAWANSVWRGKISFLFKTLYKVYLYVRIN